MSIEDLSYTIVPKSDQLNADDMISGPMTVTVTDVRPGAKDQPVMIDIGGKVPYKPCLTMRRVLIKAWGKNGSAWVGRSMTLYCDPTVRFGPNAVGGIRISHLSHIDGPLVILLTTSRMRRTEFTFQPLAVNCSSVIERYTEMSDEERNAEWPKFNSSEQSAIINAFK